MKTRPSMIGLVTGRELRDRLRRPSYYVISGLFVVLILAFGVGARLVSQSAPGSIEVALTGGDRAEVSRALQDVAGAAERTAEVHATSSEAAALELFDDDQVEFVVDTDRGAVTITDDADPTDVALVQQAWTITRLQSNLEAAGLTDAAAARAMNVEALDPVARSRPGSTSAVAALTGTLAAALLFVSLQIFGGQILGSVVEEKSTGVVEVLLARVRADELLGGKILGVGITAVSQFASMVVAGVIALWISGTTLPGAVWTAVPMTVVWYLMGFAFYAMLFALAGSLVSRQEDANAAAAPITTALIGAYALLFIVGTSPDSIAARVLSILPPFAPILMPLRMAAGIAGPAEVVLALVLGVAGILLVWKFTARVYAQVLLRRGARIRWSDAWTAARARPH